MMNTVATSIQKNENVLLSTFLNSLYYTFPFGMFLIACNFLFESVRNYYFDWMIVVLPTVVVCLIINVYEMLKMYQKIGFFKKSENNFTAPQVSYSISNSNLVTT